MDFGKNRYELSVKSTELFHYKEFEFGRDSSNGKIVESKIV